MCEDEGNRGGDRTAEATHCWHWWEGKRWVVPVVPVGGGQWMIKCGEAMRGMLGRAHLSLRGGREEVRRQDVKRREGLKTMVGKAMGAKETGRREMGERRRERRRQE